MSLANKPTYHRSDSVNSFTSTESNKYLSEFQVEKFKYLFDAFFDMDKNDFIERSDIVAFIDKLSSYAGWKEGSKEHTHLLDVQNTFYECIKDQIIAEYQAEETTEEEAMLPWSEAFKRHGNVDTSRMSLNQWLNMWGRLCYGSAGISDFPIWVQLLPEIFFEVMDRDGDGVASYEEVKNYYRHLIGITDPKKLEKTAKEGYRVLTANGDYTLNKSHFFFCFANFLLGKGIYGPGKYIFGVFDNRELDEKFKIIYNDEAEKMK